MKKMLSKAVTDTIFNDKSTVSLLLSQIVLIMKV